MIGQVWFSRSSMIVSGESGTLSFAKGALIKQEPNNCLADMLSDDFVSVQPTDLSGGSWLQTGKEFCVDLLRRLPPESFWNRSCIPFVHIFLKLNPFFH